MMQKKLFIEHLIIARRMSAKRLYTFISSLPRFVCLFVFVLNSRIVARIQLFSFCLLQVSYNSYHGGKQITFFSLVAFISLLHPKITNTVSTKRKLGSSDMLVNTTRRSVHVLAVPDQRTVRYI